MKTQLFFGKQSVNSLKHGEAGSVAKAFLGLLAVGSVCAGGFYLYAKGKPASENPLTQLTQSVQSAVADVLPDTQKADAAPAAEAPESATTGVQNQPPGQAAAPASAAAVANATPLPLRTAPSGMVFLAKRITVTRESGLTSFPAGTLLLVKAKDGGKIRGSINGVSVEVAEKETSSTFQQ